MEELVKNQMELTHAVDLLPTPSVTKLEKFHYHIVSLYNNPYEGDIWRWVRLR